MAKKDLPDNEELYSIDAPDVDGADGGWDDWDDDAVDVDVSSAEAEVSDVDLSVEAEASEVDVAQDERPSDDTPVEAPEAEYEVEDAQEDWGDEDWDEGADAFEEPPVEVDVSEDNVASEAPPVEEQEAVVEEASPAEAFVAETAEETTAPLEREATVAAEDLADELDIEEIPDVAASAAPDETQGELASDDSDDAEVRARFVEETEDGAVKLPFDEVIRDYLDESDEQEEQAAALEEDNEPAGELQVSDEELAEFLPPEPTPEAQTEDVAPTEEQAEPTAEEQEASLDAALEESEVVKSEEEIKREQEELEAYREAMGETNAEMADVSEYRTFRKKTKTESKSSIPKKSDFDLFANRYKVKTMNAMVAASDPIVYFYNACLRPDGSILAFNVYQVLQDRFLGKMVPQLFTAVAENSAKIEDLNEANLLEQLKTCAEFPQYDFIISISARFFTKPALLDRLLRLLPDGGVPNLVLAFDCTSLENIAIAAKAGLGAVHQKGVKILLDNTEKVTMTVLSEFDYDFIRIDSRYYEIGNPRAEAYLRLLLSLTKEQNVSSIATFCDSEDLSEYMFFMGVDAIQGNATSRPMRTVPNAVKGITLLPSMLDE